MLFIMRKILFLIFLCFLTTLPIALHAQDGEVPLRISDKADYTRIVFNWSQTVGYDVNNKNGNLTVSFDRSASINLDSASGKNVFSYDVNKVSPLHISFKIPKSSKVRDFKIGKRVIFDVYDPTDPKERSIPPAPQQVKSKEQPKSAPKKTAQKESEKKEQAATKVASKPKSVTPKQIRQKQKPPKQVENKKQVKNKSGFPATPPSIVLVPEILPSKTAKQSKEDQKTLAAKETSKKNAALKKAVKQENHVITMRSTQGFGLGVFENRNELWIIIDDKNSTVTPKLSSPTPEIFGAILPVENADVKIYKMALPKNAKNMKTLIRGGGLVWDIIIGDKVKEKPVPDPIITTKNEIILPLNDISKIFEITDPQTGQPFTIITTEEALQFGSKARSFIEFDVYHSPIGLAIFSKIDDLKMTQRAQGLQISRPKGLAVAKESERKAALLFAQQNTGKKTTKSEDKHDNTKDQKKHDQKPKKEDKNLYKFKNWSLGKVKDLRENQNLLLASYGDKSKSRRVEDLITLGKMNLSHGFASEAQGYFSFAATELPQLTQSTEFKALRGAAHALDWKNELALGDLFHESIKDKDEVRYFAAHALANLGDWQQAASVLPENYQPLYDYPMQIGHRLALSLAEVNLRAGKVKIAEELLSIVEQDKKYAIKQDIAALQYLKGEAARQKGDKEKTKDLWDDLAEGDDDLYLVKAGLALTILEANENDIDEEERIDRLETLRYSWRGDDLESQVKYWLGKAYFDKKEYIVGLSIMRDAVEIAGPTTLADRIAADMGKTFERLYLTPALKDVPPLQAVAVFEEFKELTPLGPRGRLLEQALAEHLVRSELIGRASKILNQQVDHRLKGEEKLRIAIRLAAIELIGDNPQKAVDALAKASQVLSSIEDPEERAQKRREIEFLRIRAYAQNEQYDRALELLEALPPSQIVNRLKADIAWQAGYWDEAAVYLNAVIVDENLTDQNTLNQEQTDLILNRAIALNLDGKQVALANMRQKYSAQMQETNKANQFELITRPRRSGASINREALLSAVAEVDLFKEFIENYRQN